MRIHLLAAVAALGIAAPAAAEVFIPSQIVAFGDSFIDSGNIQAAVGPAFTNPNLGYWYGRFSDGPTWADYLSIASGQGALKPSLLGGTNFAFGGARGAGDDNVMGGTIPGLSAQAFLFQATGAPIDPNALYIINFGNNDVSALQNGDLEGLTAEQFAQAYVTNMAGIAGGLLGAGARHVLIAGVPNPLETEGQVLQAQLDDALDIVETFLLPGQNLYRYDYFDFFTRLGADPTQFRLPADIDLTTPCLVGEIPSRDIDCTGYLQFDQIHVTRAVQQAIAVDMARQFNFASIPEPATWGLMIAGFGAVGIAMRRRRLAAA